MRKRKVSSQIWAICLIILFVSYVVPTFVLSHEKKTSDGNNIDHKHKREFTEKQMEEAKKKKKKQEEEFGDKIKQVENDGPTRGYNCGGLVFCNKTSWVTKLGVLEALFDGGYRKLKEGEKPKKGDLVLYYKNGQLQHIGKVEEVDDKGNVKKVRSKWGSGGEFIHDPDAVPSSYGTPSVRTNR